MATNEERKQQLLRAGNESKVAAEWMAVHIEDYIQSQQNAKIIGDYLDQKGLLFTYRNLEEAFEFAKSQGWDFTKVNTPITASAPAAPVTPAEEPLPEIPDWFPPMNNKADLWAIPRAKFRELLTGKAGEKFLARVNAVGKRGL